MLEAFAAVAIVLLVAREFLAQARGEAPRTVARLAGWAAWPFLLGFGALFAVRVWGYLGGA